MHLKSLFTVGLAAAAIAVPAAQAADDGTLLFRASQAAASAQPPSAVTDDGTLLSKAAQAARSVTPRSSGSYLGHVGGPGSVGVIHKISAPSSGPGFAWDDAAIGAGFTAGLGLIGAAALLATRRRATLAHSSS